MMRPTLALLAALVAAPAAAQAPTLERAGADMKVLLRDLRGRANAEKVSVKAVEAKNIWQETDCEVIEFAEGAGPVSDSKKLETRTWLEECRHIPFPNPPGGGTCIPERRLISWDEATVRVEIAERAQNAPKETFRACMTGRWLSLKVKQSPFKYDVKEKDGVFTLKRK